MVAAVRILLVLLFADAAFLLWLLISQGLIANTLKIADIAPIIVLAGVITALMALLFNLERSRSEDILEASRDLLEKGYQALLKSDGTLSNGRHAWLSAARLMASAESLSARLTEPSHKTIYEQTREFWRGRTYDLIFPKVPDGLRSTFYAEKPEHMIAYSGDVRDPLAEKSLAYLYRFIRWPDGVPDPIGEQLVFSEDEIRKMTTFGPRGLGQLLTDVRAFAQKPRRDA